jgi:hypothetical protein
MKLNFNAALVLCMTLATAQADTGITEVLTPAQYFNCQIAAREATLKGLEERAQLMKNPTATLAEKRSAGEITRHRVSLAMASCGQPNAGTLGAYAHRNADALQTWLNANPPVQAQLDALSQRVAGLSSQMAPPAASQSGQR